jgi:uncharacterized membrane protein YhdT
MKIRQHIDSLLWPHVKQRWVYAILMIAYFVGIAASALLHPLWFVVACDLTSLVLAIVTLDSRDRYVMWRDAHVRRRSR